MKIIMIYLYTHVDFISSFSYDELNKGLFSDFTGSSLLQMSMSKLQSYPYANSSFIQNILCVLFCGGNVLINKIIIGSSKDHIDGYILASYIHLWLTPYFVAKFSGQIYLKVFIKTWHAP